MILVCGLAWAQAPEMLLSDQQPVTDNSDGVLVTNTISSIGFASVWNRQGAVLIASITNDFGVVAEPTLIQPEGNPIILTNLTTVWKMWFSDGWTYPNICYAESPDGIKWTRYSAPVVTNCARPFVIKNGATYYLYVEPFAAWHQLDCYLSTNGVSFSLLASSVITTNNGSWISLSPANSGGVYTNGTLYLYVEGMTTNVGGLYNIGLFTSQDFTNFTPYSGNPLITGMSASGPSTPYLVGSTWWMWIHGNITGVNAPTDIYRFSAPALTGPWSATPANPVLSRKTADEGAGQYYGQCADPYIMDVNAKTYMFYTAAPDSASPNQRIKLAIADMSISSLVQTSEGDGTNFGFNITGDSGRDVVVDACTNLSNPVWLPVHTNTLFGGSSYFNDPQWLNFPFRFYRLRSQ